MIISSANPSLKKVRLLLLSMVLSIPGLSQVNQFNAALYPGNRSTEMEEFKIDYNNPQYSGKVILDPDKIIFDSESEHFEFRKLMNLYRHCSDPVFHWVVQDANGRLWEAYMNYKTTANRSIAYIHLDSAHETIVLVEQK